MSQYAAIADMERARGTEHVRSLSDKDNTGTRVDAALNEALARASSLADSYIDKKYEVPLGNPPDYLIAAVIDIAEYQLAPDSMIGTENMRTRYEDALKLFKEIGKGNVTLAGNSPASSGQVEGATGSKGVQMVAPERLFTRNSEIL